MRAELMRAAVTKVERHSHDAGPEACPQHLEQHRPIEVFSASVNPAFAA
jgi:hypothetical protein